MAETERRRLRQRRKKRARRQIRFAERPILTVYRSGRHTYAQIVDPFDGHTLTSASTLSPSVRDGLKSAKDKDAAKKVGEQIAKLAKEREIHQVTFNRNGFTFGGRVKALADGAREAGLQF